MDRLAELRSNIDCIDDEIILLLAQRKVLVLEVSKEKKMLNKKTFDSEREKAIFSRISDKAEELGLNPESIKSVYEIILKQSKEDQG